jgi:Zn-dependent peptidase ImmA (M78 family)/predicted secreted protein
VSARRDAILRATQEAALILSRFAVGERTSFDIVGAVTALGIPVLFRPLDKLLGALITVDGDARGILVTTKRSLAVQRFTLAHELGHILLGHEQSFDEVIGFAGRFEASSRTTPEIAADTFAAELLAPRDLMLASAKRHQWNQSALSDPASVYQLALRLGVSFQAACWALAAQDVIARNRAETLQALQVKDLKVAVASAALLQDSWADTWSLGEGDSGTFLEAGPNDVFAVALREMSSAGYLWDLVDPGPHSQVLEERNDVVEGYGDSGGRTVVLRFTAPGIHRLSFAHRRPWNKETLAHIDIAIANFGKEQGGFARRLRESALAGTAA